MQFTSEEALRITQAIREIQETSDPKPPNALEALREAYAEGSLHMIKDPMFHAQMRVIEQSIRLFLKNLAEALEKPVKAQGEPGAA